MGILNDFERRLEGAIEGIFTKAFRSGVQPVELAKRVLKEMEANKTVGVHEVWVPNLFVFQLSTADRERFANAERSLRRELEQVVRDGAKQRGWTLVGPVQVDFETDPSLKHGVFTCAPLLVEGPPTPPPADAPPAEPAAPADPAIDGRADLVFIEDGKPGRALALAKPRIVLGRLPECDVVLSDPGASRRHAEIRRANGGFVIKDLGSTNGTLVNQSNVTEQPLTDGDRITIGRTVLEFRSS